MRPRASGHRKAAFTLTELVVIVMTIIILAALLLPALAAAKRKNSRISCVNNLKEDYLAFKIWEGDNGDQFPMKLSTNYDGALEYAEQDEIYRCFQVTSNQLGSPKTLICPTDVRRWANDWSTLRNTNISYFVNIDASESYPEMIIFGDRNIVGGTRSPNGLTIFNPTNPIYWSTEMHNGSGNVGLTDGSVAQLTSEGLSRAFAPSTNAGLGTLRYAFP